VLQYFGYELVRRQVLRNQRQTPVQLCWDIGRKLSLWAKKLRLSPMGNSHRLSGQMLCGLRYSWLVLKQMGHVAVFFYKLFSVFCVNLVYVQENVVKQRSSHL